MASTVLRNDIVSPFPTRTKLLDKNGSMSWEHQKHQQEMVTGINSSVQLATTVPASSTSAGTPGTLISDGNFLYYCIASGNWKRVALAAF